tara:strand:- start:322 stop:687 length:366 start_codon:yes stop_codon:yes gene_type:complete
MDYKGKTFKSEWKDNILFIEVNEYDDDMFGLLHIIIDAAEKQGDYNMLWDFRMADHPGFMKMPKIMYNIAKLYSVTKNVQRSSILVQHKNNSLTNTIIKTLNFYDTSYIGCNPVEAMQHIS